MSFYQNYKFKASGSVLTGVADFTAAAVGTVFEKASGELFTKNTQALFEKTARVIPSFVDVTNAVSTHQTNTTYHKQNMTTTIDPLSTSDSSAGYSVGSVWINTSTNTAFTCTDVTVGAAQWTSGFVPAASAASIPLTQKGAASGVATLDASGNLVKGLKAFNGKDVNLANDTDLGALPTTISSGFYDVQYTAAGTVANRRGLGVAWYHLEIQRHSNDTAGNRYYTVRATPLDFAGTDVWVLNVRGGVVTNFIRQNAAVEVTAGNALSTANLAYNSSTFNARATYGPTNTNITQTVGLTYTNSTINVLYVSAYLVINVGFGAAEALAYGNVDNLVVARLGWVGGAIGANGIISLIVPAGSTYSITVPASTSVTFSSIITSF